MRALYLKGLRIHLCVAKVSVSQQFIAKYSQSRWVCSAVSESKLRLQETAVCKPAVETVTYQVTCKVACHVRSSTVRPEQRMIYHKIILCYKYRHTSDSGSRNFQH